MNISDLKAWEMKDKLLSGQISSVEIMNSHIKNIEEKEKDINAFISFDKEKAMQKAKEIDKKLKNKEKLGILVGLPIAVKDNIITREFKTTGGSKMLENFLPPFDASVAKKIGQEDGIIIGKTNMDEFGIGRNTSHSHFGPTKNPLDLSKTIGGSSGGSAASVKAREAALSLGTDTGGSIRKPAAYSSLVGFKPSYGLVSRYGLISLSNSLDTIGTLARDVRDASMVLEAIYGVDSLDDTTLAKEVNLNPEAGTGSLKIGLIKEWMDLDMDPMVRKEFLNSVEVFKDLGAKIEEVSLPTIVHTPMVYKIIAYSDISSNMARFDGIRYGFRAKDYESLDELYIRSRSEGLGENVKKSILFGTYLLSGHRGEGYYKKAQMIRTKLIKDFKEAFEKFDILLAPSNLNLPDSLDLSATYYDDYSESINLAGLPSMSLPVKEDCPIGIQLIGNNFKEETIIKAALAFEKAVK